MGLNGVSEAVPPMHNPSIEELKLILLKRVFRISKKILFHTKPKMCGITRARMDLNGLS